MGIYRDGSIYVSDQKGSVDYLLGVLIDSPSLAVAINRDEKTIYLNDTSLVEDGFYIGLQFGRNEFQAQILSHDDGLNTITVDTPVDTNYPLGSTVKIRNCNLALDGSTDTLIAYVSPIAGQKWDITRMIVNITSTGEPDDTKFGDIASLEHGLVVRNYNVDNNGTIFNVKNNGNFRERSYDTEYKEKAGGGAWSTSMRKTFKSNGVVFRVDGDKSGQFQILIQDDLTVGGTIESFRVTIGGHVVYN